MANLLHNQALRLLPDLDDERGWRHRLYEFAAATILIFLYQALFEPGTLRFAPFTIQDDARQFMAWMPQLREPTLLQGDPLAEYWKSVSPWLYRLPFMAWAAAGLDPILLGRLIPAPLLGAAAWLSWRVARRMTDTPRAAFVAAAFLFAFLAHEDSIYSATPRALSPILLLAFIDALPQRRWITMFACIFGLGAIYPTTAPICLGLLGVSLVQVHPRLRLDLNLRTVALLALGVGIMFVAAVPLGSSSASWGPALTFEEARTLPSLMTPGARSTIVDEAGRIGWICSSRMGFLPEVAPCGRGFPFAWLIDLLLMVPLLFLAWRALRGKPAWSGQTDRLYLDALAVAAVLFTLAALVAFKLHLPSRYSQRVLGILEWLAIGQMIGSWVDHRLRASRNNWGVKLAGGAVALVLLGLFLSPTPGFKRPESEALVRRIAALPKGARIAGVTEELAMIPAVTGRRILASTEHAIPWHDGYRRMIDAGLRQSLVLVSTGDAAKFEALRAQLGVTHLLVERATLQRGEIGKRYAGIVPDAVAAARAALAGGGSVLVKRAAGCAVFSDRELVLVDARCVGGGR